MPGSGRRCARELAPRRPMIIGTVRGDIVSTINHPFYTGKKLLVVEKEDPSGKPGGSSPT